MPAVAVVDLMVPLLVNLQQDLVEQAGADKVQALKPQLMEPMDSAEERVELVDKLAEELVVLEPSQRILLILLQRHIL